VQIIIIPLLNQVQHRNLFHISINKLLNGERFAARYFISINLAVLLCILPVDDDALNKAK